MKCGESVESQRNDAENHQFLSKLKFHPISEIFLQNFLDINCPPLPPQATSITMIYIKTKSKKYTYLKSPKNTPKTPISMKFLTFESLSFLCNTSLYFQMCNVQYTK